MARVYSGGVNSVIAPFQNALTFIVQKVGVPTAGTPVNLPSITIPDGRELTVRAKVTNEKKLIFVANSSANALLPANRLVLSAGESLGLFVDDADKVWIDSDTNGMEVELIVEQ